MRNRKPFTQEQRQNAAMVYQSFRSTIAALSERFRPRNSQQRQTVRELRESIREFAITLQRENAKIDAGRLNMLREKADRLAVDYACFCLGRHDDA